MNDVAVKRALQEITGDNNLKVLNYVADLLIRNWQSNSSVGVSEWETVKNVIMKEERAKALRLFLEEIERIAHE